MSEQNGSGLDPAQDAEEVPAPQFELHDEVAGKIVVLRLDETPTKLADEAYTILAKELVDRGAALVVRLPVGARLEVLDEAGMAEAGWVRA